MEQQQQPTSIFILLQLDQFKSTIFFEFELVQVFGK